MLVFVWMLLMLVLQLLMVGRKLLPREAIFNFPVAAVGLMLQMHFENKASKSPARGFLLKKTEENGHKRSPLAACAPFSLHCSVNIIYTISRSCAAIHCTKMPPAKKKEVEFVPTKEVSAVTALL